MGCRSDGDKGGHCRQLVQSCSATGSRMPCGGFISILVQCVFDELPAVHLQRMPRKSEQLPVSRELPLSLQRSRRSNNFDRFSWEGGPVRVQQASRCGPPALPRSAVFSSVHSASTEESRDLRQMVACMRNGPRPLRNRLITLSFVSSRVFISAEVHCPRGDGLREDGRTKRCAFSRLENECPPEYECFFDGSTYGCCPTSGTARHSKLIHQELSPKRFREHLRSVFRRRRAL